MTDELHASEIVWDLEPAPWPDPTDLLDLALESLFLVDDRLAVSLIEKLATAVVDQREELNAVRLVQSVGSQLLHDQHVENDRLKLRLNEARDRNRALNARTGRITGTKCTDGAPGRSAGTECRDAKTRRDETRQNKKRRL